MRGRAAGRQHLPWFKIPLKTMSRESIFYQSVNMSGEDSEKFHQPSFFFLFFKDIHKELDISKVTSSFSFLVLFNQILYLTETLGALLPWRRTVSNVRHGKFRKGMWLPWKQPHE